MESRQNFQIQRNDPRYKAMHRALVMVTRGPEALPFHIIDISRGGLSFRYLGKKIDKSAISEISLYHDYELLIDSLPAKAVSDYRLRDNLVPVRRGSICFADLTSKQQQNLEMFIANFTEASAPSYS
jgi:hypothetical protein